MAQKVVYSKSQITKQDIVNMLRAYWEDVATNIFKWKGLEDISPTLTSQIIERTLFKKGKLAFFNDEMLGYLALPVAPYEYLNVYGEPSKYVASGVNYHKELTPENSVLVKNTTTSQSTLSMIDYYIDAIANIEMTKRLRMNTHKTPLAIMCDEKTELSARNIFNKIDGNEPIIYQNRGEMIGSVTVLNFDVQYINDKLDDEINTYNAKILTILGLDNYVEDKKERVQSAEVDAQSEYIIANFRSMLEMRQKACKEINEMFGLNLSIEYVQGDQIEPNDKKESDDVWQDIPQL